jgi:hypothetical protein
MKLNVKALTFSLGITWGLYMLVLGWVGAFGWGEEAIIIFSSFYIGFEASFVGGIIGAIWGFIDGVVGGLIIAFLYNSFCTKPRKPRKAAKKRKR